MSNLDEIHEYIKTATMILVINNNSKAMLDALYNFIYKKYPNQKSKWGNGKGLFFKLCNVKNKLIRIDIDLYKVQFHSSNTHGRIREDYNSLMCCAVENNSKFLFKSDLSLYKEEIDLRDPWYIIFPQYQSFDLVIFIDKDKITILKEGNYTSRTKENYDITTLLRRTKLKKIQFLHDKESL